MEQPVMAAPLAAPAPEAVSAGGLIGRTFSTWSRNLLPFVLLSMVSTGPNFVFGLWSQYATYGGFPAFGQRVSALSRPVTVQAARLGGPTFAILTGAVFIATLILMFVQMGALTYGTVQHLAGRRVTLGALLGAGFRRSWTVFATGFAAGILILGASLLLLVPGVIVLCATMAAVPAAVAEGIGPGAAVKRSFALTKGRRFPIFGAFLVMGAVSWSAAMVSGFLPLVLGGGFPTLVGSLVGFVVTAFTTPLMTLLPAVAYHDLRVEKEGVDTAELAKVFE